MVNIKLCEHKRKKNSNNYNQECYHANLTFDCQYNNLSVIILCYFAIP